MQIYCIPVLWRVFILAIHYTGFIYDNSSKIRLASERVKPSA